MQLRFLFILIFQCTCFFITKANDSCVTKPYAINLTITKTNTTCERFNGRIKIVATGGVAPYNYVIDGLYPYPINNSTGIFGMLPSGTAFITVTDALGETATQTVVLSNTFNQPNVDAFVVNQPTDCLTSDGSIRLVGSGGLPPYLYSMDNVNYQNSNIFSNLPAGYYEVTVKDANGCISVNRERNSFPAYIQLTENIFSNCFTLSGATFYYNCYPIYHFNIVISNVIGGVPPYLYSKDDINYQTSNSFPNMVMGVNYFWIKDAVGNKKKYGVGFLVACNTNFTLLAQTQVAQCGADGSITATASNGIAPYEYSIDGVNFSTNNIFTGLTPGYYTVRARDGDGLLSYKYVEIKNSCTVALANVTNSSCGNANGKIDVTGANGIAPYTYSIDGINYSSNTTYTNLAANNYRVYAKDANSKIGFADVVVVNIAGATISNTTIKNSGCENKTGEITATGTGGKTPYEFNINGGNFQTSNTFTNLSSTNYTVGIKDGNGCVTTTNVFVPLKPDLPTVNLGNDKTLCEDETITLDATNTNATYEWQDNSKNATYSVTKAGQYFVIVNKQGCIAKDTINVNYNLKPKFTLGADRQICVGTNILLDPKITDVSYTWQDGSINKTYLANKEGRYSLTATNFCGSTTDEINLTKGVCELYVPNAFTPNGDIWNNEFKAYYGDNVSEFKLQVFNRYGQLLFITTDKNKGWNGTVGGVAQQQGAYTWVIEYRIKQTVEANVLKGVVMLLR